ncbi:hypothetical protein C8R45DRAFT_381349 [Mycena sanguinolenta]|nr:hypothetical protein C8R45DRAFT_381349 [Mycena sanguinolenta]
MDLTPYQALLEVQGLTVSAIKSLATWTPAELHEGLQRLLKGSASALGYPGMPGLMFVAFEGAVLQLKDKGTDLPGESLLLPPRNANVTMPLFLKNVHGFNLTSYAALLDAQGFSILALDAMLSWDPAMVRKALKFTLLDPVRLEGKERAESHVPGTRLKGMSAVEVLAMEFCLRKAVEDRKKVGP